MQDRRHTRRALPLLDQLDDRCLLSGYTPAQITSAYGLNAITFTSSAGSTIKGDGSGETIALIEEYHDPNIQSDLKTFDRTYNLPDPSLTVVNQAGNQTNNGWALEESMDVEYAHAIAPGANILVVEAAPARSQTKELQNQLNAVNTARAHDGRGGDLDELGVQRDVQRGVLRQVLHDPRRAYGHHVHRLQRRLRLRRVSVGLAQCPLRRRDLALPDQLGELPVRDRLVLQRRRLQPVRAGAELSEVGANDRAADHARRGVRRRPEYGRRGLRDLAPFGQRIVASLRGTSLGAPAWAGIIAIVDQGRALAGKGSLDGPTQTLPALYALPSSDFHSVSPSPLLGGLSSWLWYLFGSGSTGATANIATGLGSPNGPSLIAGLVASTTTSPKTSASGQGGS